MRLPKEVREFIVAVLRLGLTVTDNEIADPNDKTVNITQVAHGRQWLAFQEKQNALRKKHPRLRRYGVHPKR